jgi:transaldolase/transaldolase/glucose-6-phosphate isomerase
MEAQSIAAENIKAAHMHASCFRLKICGISFNKHLTPMTSIKKIHDFGQSIWLDALDRQMLQSGELKKYIFEEGIRGITSNPSIFEKAIDQGEGYTDDITKFAGTEKSNEDIFFSLAIKDIRRAADLLAPVYEEGKSPAEGYVSLEVSPHLARLKDETIRQAQHLWQTVDRPNVMIKIPGTIEGLPAIRECIRRGININITLLFSLERYRAVTEAYLSGLEDRLKDDQEIDHIASVASFFLSRIDVMTDPILEEKGLRDIKGEVAIASAKTAYQMYKKIFDSDRFDRLKARGARPQILLWASTSVKDPAYSDVKYVEALIGYDTINTIPVKTLKAYLDHGNPQENTLEEGLKNAASVMDKLKKAGIALDSITDKLESEGIEKFIQPYDKLLHTIEQQREKVS